MNLNIRLPELLDRDVRNALLIRKVLWRSATIVSINYGSIVVPNHTESTAIIPLVKSGIRLLGINADSSQNK